MKRCLLVMIVVAAMLITGCAEPKILEENGIIYLYGVDIDEENQLSTTSVFYKFGSKNKAPSQIVTEQGNTLANGQKRMNYKLGFSLQSGSIEMEVFGKQAAKQGLISYLESASRHPKASSKRMLTVSDTTAKDLITTIDNMPKTNVTRALPNNIEFNSDTDVIPRVKLHDFQHHYYDTGRDPVLPIMTYQDNKAKLTALGLFQDDQLVGKVPVNQAFYINMADKNIHGLEQEIELPFEPFKQYMKKDASKDKDREHFYTVFNIKKGESKFKLKSKDNLRFHTELNFSVNILELTEQIDLEKQAAIKTFEAETEKVIKQEYTQLIKQLKEQNVDPIGYGVIYKSHKRSGPLTKSEWRDKFPDITVDVDVNVDMLDQGVTP